MNGTSNGGGTGVKSGLKRLVVADPLLPDGFDVLREASGLAVEDHTEDDREALSRALRGASALIVRSRTKVDAGLIRAGDALEVIGRAGVGVDNIDIGAATRRGIAVLNAPGANTFSTAELTFGLLLATARRLAEADASIRAGEWKRKQLRGIQLHGKTMGVVGLGRIGAEMTRRARAFGMRVVGHDPYVGPERANELGVELLDLDELLPVADVVTLHVPLTEENRDLIGADRIEAMPEGSILLNAARGGLVDESALAAALESGHLAAAALDVYASEPLPEDSPLRGAPNLVMSPHIGASTIEAQREVSRQIAVAVRDALLLDDYQAALNAPFEEGDRALTGPIMELGRRLGALLDALDENRHTRLDVRYAGPVEGVLRPLAAAAVEGYLRSRVEPPINVLNALSIAGERGLEVARVRTAAVVDYTNYVELSVPSGEGADVVVGGALLADRQHPRIVRVGDFHVDTVPRGTLLLVRNDDVPGVIGKVGSQLGEARVNIAEYHQARQEAGGEALGLVTVDGKVPAEVLERIREVPDVREVRQVVFS